ncbi:Zn-dependent hydrolase [Aminivibrio sp.]|uniref:Zn-dependent hydrolase n=1 Tax=Aminivibrio sp. TaxID=1872489 RepID=UPI001A5A7BBB|nr:Zn-dependent hydrolase [Aminivibrio sp.]MBL3539582.1 Zn-dependent hydrolase [Aminivibrio sp.]MDK2959579.1 beta-ureidopropionase / N-carbamoyl-L-amino-acid hydrolase [Synergistaceae bacterium]
MTSGGNSPSRPVVRGDVLLGQIESLASVGLDSEGGRTRLALSESEKAGRDLVVRWMEEAGLEVRVDRIGNIFGILRGADGGLGNGLMIGSHIDTVIHAGPFDGCYGVLSGLAVLRAFREAGVVPPRPLAVAAFTNEEGVRFQPDMLGSLVAAGGMPLGEALNIADGQGCTVGEALAAIGCSGGEEPGFLLPSEYLELHVEQGPRLDAEKKRIGVVEGVQGISWWRVTVEGTANHAGTTPMKMRHDAGYAAALVSVFLRERSLSSGTTLATVGTIAFEPCAVNVIPSKAVFTVDLRDPDGAKLTEAEEGLAAFLEKTALEEGVRILSEHLVRCEPVVFDRELVQTVEDAAVSKGYSSMRLVSGAGHDAQMMAGVCRAAMIFVPSIGGVSHSPDEKTSAGDLLAGVDVLLDVVLRVLGF